MDRQRFATTRGVLLAAMLAAGGTGVESARAEEGNFFTNMLKYGGPTVPPSQPDDSDPAYCPTVAVPEGGAAIRLGDGTALRHQVTLGRLARECTRLQDGTLSVKVGVAGQVLLGPAGRPGRFDAPVTITLKANDRTFQSRVHRVAVTVPAGQAQGLFSFVEDELVVPAALARDYDIEVTLGGAPKRAAPRRKKAPVAATSEDSAAAPTTDAAQ